MSLSFVEGNQAIAMGAVAAGCRFFAGYPITPATTIFNTMLELLPPAGGICLQGEDEIASIGFCLGASMAGMKTMTATSGPGISLYSEQLSFAIGSEIPIVIVDVQRLGPSTGSATKGADGDIQFMRWGNSSGLPVIVLSPVDVKDCFTLTIHAFNLAERFRCPVFIAANKEISMTRETIDMEALTIPEIKGRVLASTTKKFLPFEVDFDVNADNDVDADNNNADADNDDADNDADADADNVDADNDADEKNYVPAFLPMGGKEIVRQTSSTHGPDGYITTDPVQIEKNQIRLKQKVEGFVESFSFFDEIMETNSTTLIITYGVTARAAAEAVKSINMASSINMTSTNNIASANMTSTNNMASTNMTSEASPRVSLLVLKTLWPVPEALIRDKAKQFKRIVVVEMNLGQYVREIERILSQKKIDFLGTMNGSLITPDEIKEAVSL